jgi:uncharacterized protein
VDDLTVGMALQGQVLNVVDFGIFVDIGIGESGLVHISNLSHEYVRDPHRYYGVGDILDVWVQSIDRKRGRVALTAIDPQSKSARDSRAHGGQRGTRGQRAKAPTGSRERRSGSSVGEQRSNASSAPGQTTGPGADVAKSGATQESRRRQDAGHRQSDRRHGDKVDSSAHVGRNDRRESTGDRRRGPGQSGQHRRRDDQRSTEQDRSPRSQTRSKRPPAAPVALTEGMLQGTEPLRSFSELLQLVKRNQKPPQDR